MRAGSRSRSAKLVAGALTGDRAAVRALVDVLTPVIQARVARMLLRHRGARSGRDPRPEIEDLTQETFALLFRDGAAVLRRWDPDRGLSLENFVGLVAQRQTISMLRSGRRNPWAEDPTLQEDLERGAHLSLVVSLDDVISSRELLRELVAQLKEHLSPTGYHLFEELIVRERPIRQVAEAMDMSHDALYAWRSRLKKLARKLARELDRPTRRREAGGAG